MNQEEKPRAPEVGEFVGGHGKVLSTHDITPPVEKRTGYLFENHDATVFMRVNGIDVKEFVTCHSLWGIESCLKNAVEEAECEAKRYAGDNVEIVVVHNTYYCLAEVDPFTQNYHDKKFHNFTRSNHGFELRDQIPENKSEDYWSSSKGYLKVANPVTGKLEDVE